MAPLLIKLYFIVDLVEGLLLVLHIIENERLRLPGQVFWRWSDVDHLGRYSEGEATSTTWADILKVKWRRPHGQVFWRWSDLDHQGRYSEGEATWITWADILKVKRRRPPGQVFWRWKCFTVRYSIWTVYKTWIDIINGFIVVVIILFSMFALIGRLRTLGMS